MKNNENTLLNLPNKISLFRFVCTPIMIVMFLVAIPKGIGVFIALAIYLLGSFSDLLDGYIARKLNIVTDFGKFIDAIADKFLQTSAIILVIFSNVIEPSWVGVLILLILILRDIEISGIRMISASKGVVIAADKIGKIKSFFIDAGTVLLMFYIGLVQNSSLGDSGSLWFVPLNYIQVLGFAVLLVGTVLSLISCVNYTINAWPIIIGDDLKKSQTSEIKNDPLKKLFTASGREAVSKEKQYEFSREKRYVVDKENMGKKQCPIDIQSQTNIKEPAKRGRPKSNPDAVKTSSTTHSKNVSKNQEDKK